MEMQDKVRNLVGRIEKHRGSILTEEACKTAFVMPFLNMLGYDVFNPDVVVPEFVADVGIKKGEKVDYAIRVGGQISILIECKCSSANLKEVHMSQLYRYFHVTEAKFAILTNGIEYWFYTDIDEPNKMDQIPFFKFNFLSHRSADVLELQKFSSDQFNVDNIVSTANNLKYSSALKNEFSKEITSPSDEFCKILVSRIVSGSMTSKVKEKYYGLVKSAINDALADILSDRISSALDMTSGAATSLARSGFVEPVPQPVSAPTIEVPQKSEGEEEVVTTQEELEGYYVVKAIVRNVISGERVSIRDAKSYCAILVDNNNRKPLARLHLNSKSVKYIGLFRGKDEEKFKIENIDDIYKYDEMLRETARQYV
ncbi:type I restriction endonuclease [Niveispirillum sp.]|uniref:type I restriction endonuclease n=2 Tax=Niveispirillum sp. TaxID=1917217 RepID=UPI004035FFDD